MHTEHTNTRGRPRVLQPTDVPTITEVATPASDILTRDEVASWLKVKSRQVERLGVPCIRLGFKTVRYSRPAVQAWLDAKGRAA